MNKLITLLLVLSFTDSFAQLSSIKYASQKKIVVNKAAVVSAHALASDAGMQVLKQGGNAFDAAIATQLVLAVVYPGAGNLGGGGFMVAHTSKGKNIALDYRETAPANASKNMYLDSAGNAITLLSMEGHLACGVPGSVAGLFAMHKYAKLPFNKLIKRAITLASDGFAITKNQAESLNENKDIFLRVNKNQTAFTKNEPWKAGDLLVQPNLANTLNRISQLGAKGFYEGETAALIVNEMKSANGIITLNDLKNYKVKQKEVLQFDYKGNQILTMPLPSSGGIILEQLLKMTKQKNLYKLPFQSAASVQLMVEAERRAYADRAEYLGDPLFVKVPVKTLVSDEYLQKRMADYQPNIAGNSTITKAGQIHESEETTHISIVDSEGNAVAVTTTLNNTYGSKTVITGAGFIMNNEMDDFSVKPGVPNMYGAIGNEKNAIEPGKTMLSSMTPTIVLKNNRPCIIVGTPGGTTIPTSVFQSIINIIDYGLSPEDAVNKPKFHHQWQPDVIYVENDFPSNTIDSLKTMGYTIVKRAQIGRTELIKINETYKDLGPTKKDSKTHYAKIINTILAIADKRGDDDARGF
jgi:gamma-glutamyltranspeptidase / glutathione hydrolase